MIHGHISWIFGILRRRRKKFHGHNSWILEVLVRKFIDWKKEFGPIYFSHRKAMAISYDSISVSLVTQLEKKMNSNECLR